MEDAGTVLGVSANGPSERRGGSSVFGDGATAPWSGVVAEEDGRDFDPSDESSCKFSQFNSSAEPHCLYSYVDAGTLKV